MGTDQRQRTRHPLSHSQYRMWLAAKVEPGNGAYTVPVALRFAGPLDLSRLQRCLDLVAARHPALRTRVVSVAGAPQQVIDLPAAIGLTERDLAAEDLDSTLRTEAARPFDLDDPPYVRATLFRLDADDHVLLLTIHHVICDGWSLNLIVDELLTAYGEPRLDAPPPARHADYADWEHSAAGQQQLAANLAYWQGQHAALNGTPDLPFALPHPPSSDDTVTAEIRITEAQVDGINALARKLHASPYAVWLAAFATTWHLATGARALPIGVPSANRGDGGMDTAVGAFVSTLPLVVRVHPGNTFADLVGTVTDVLLDGGEHEAVPVDQAAALPELPAMFVLTGQVRCPDRCGPLTVRPVPVRIEGAQTDLTCLIEEQPDGMAGRLVARPNRYDSADLDRLARGYERTLDTLLVTPDATLGSSDLLDERDRTALAEFSRAAPRPPIGFPYQAFLRWVASTPDAPAVTDAGETGLSYRLLAERVGRCVGLLRAAGVRRGSAVAVRMPRSADYPVVAFAAWHLGGWIVPLRPEDPPERIRELLRIAAAAVLVQPDAGTPIEAPGVVELDLTQLGPVDNVPEPVESTAADLAYAVFTSGTTGAPKCVAVPLGALANTLGWRVDEIALGPGDRVLQTIPLAFDPAFWQCFAPLSSGAAVVFLNRDIGADPSVLVSAAVTHQVTVIGVVPSLLGALTDRDLAALPARVVFCGGEPLPAMQADRYLRLGRGRLYHQYGPSEVCIDASSHRCHGADNDGNVPIGRPIGGVRLQVLDEWLRPVPLGVPGELHVGGPGVARGYLGRPQETAARFLPDPTGAPSDRMYRTGDWVRWTPDGRLRFLGRVDNQVKVRGHRVELEEVDRALVTLPGVTSAATVVVGGGRVGRLVAFVVSDTEPDRQAMRTTLAQRLPNYMVPTEIRVVPALPTNANGKIDRAALATTPVVAAPESADESPGLRMVREVFAAVLDVPTVGPDDDLYALGGASLGAAHIAAGLSARLGVDVPVRTVLAHPGVRDLAEIIPDLTTVSDAPEPGEAMPSTEQEYLRSLEIVLGHPAPAVTQLVDLHHDVTTAALADAVELLVARHDALRPLTGSDTSGWQPCVAVDTDELADEPVLDEHPGLQVLTLPGQVLIRLARNRGDGQSVQILADELRALLSGARLPEPAPRYRDYANWRRSRWTSRLPALADYWTSALGPVVGADPFAARRPARRGFRNHAVRQRLPADLRMGLARRSLAPSAPYLAALGRLLAELSGRSVVAVGIPVAHREHPGLRDVIGRATDLLPVVVPADAGPDTAHDGLLRGLREADLPLPMIARLVDPVSPGVRPPVCQVAVIMHESGLPEDEIGPHWSDLDLVLHAYQTELVLSGDIDLFDVAALHGHLREITHHLTGWATPGSEETT